MKKVPKMDLKKEQWWTNSECGISACAPSQIRNLHKDRVLFSV